MTIKEVKRPRNLAWSPDNYQFDSFKNMRRTSLGSLHRIEALRWRTVCEESVCRKWIEAAGAAVAKLGCVFTDLRLVEGYNGEKFPLRLVAEDTYYGNETILSDSSYWKKEGPDLPNTPLHNLAEVGRVTYWEQNVLPSKLAEVTQERLEAGNRWVWVMQRAQVLRKRASRLDGMLHIGVRESRVIPTARAHIGRLFNVELNGRSYAFEATASLVKPLGHYWPTPDDGTNTVTPPARFQVDETLLGLHEDAIRTRLGPPDLMLCTKKDVPMFGNIWIYGAAGIRFSDGYRIVDKVLTSGEVLRLIRSLERQKAKRREKAKTSK